MIIYSNREIYNCIKNYDIRMCEPFKSDSFFFRQVRKLFCNTAFMQNMINNSDLKKINDDFIIIFDSLISKSYLDWLLKYYDKRIIFWYWNPVDLALNPSKIPNCIEKWSYSENDCKKYNLNFNTTFFFKEWISEPKNNVSNDVFFVGADKGRLPKLLEYKKLFEDIGLAVNFHITKTKRTQKNNIHYKKPISYRTVLDKVLESRCIFDYNINSTVGMSLRAMESIFLNKKVITNNITYLNQDFYDPNNIFILGKDNENNLYDFIMSPYKKINMAIRDKYLFSNWLARFDR